MKYLNELAKEVNAGNTKQGFWDQFNKVIWEHQKIGTEESGAVLNAFINQSLLMVTGEIGEACEALRKDRMTKEVGVTLVNEYGAVHPTGREHFENHVKDTFEDELADALIRILDLAGGLGIDIAWHVENKLQYNKGREPKHGKKF